tara:strand:+ start:192 stop:320 length:129 start_codon:yes stop_codon:yes gene_type:complete
MKSNLDKTVFVSISEVNKYSPNIDIAYENLEEIRTIKRNFIL